MSILAFATGPSSIKQGTVNEEASTDANRIAPYVEEGMVVNSTTDNDSSYTLNFTTQQVFWLSTYFTKNQDGSFENFEGICLYLNDTLALAICSNTSEQLYIKYNTGPGTYSNSDPISTLQSNIRYRLDILFDFYNGVTKIYRDGILTDTVNVGTVPLCNKIVLKQLGGTNYYTKTTYSGTFVADEDTRDITMIQHTMDSINGETDWTGSITDVNSVGATNDSTYLSCDIDDSGYSVSLSNSYLPYEFNSGYKILAKGVYSRMKKSADYSYQMKMVTRDSTNYTDYIFVPGVVYMPYQKIMSTAPDSSAWTVTNFNSTWTELMVYPLS